MSDLKPKYLAAMRAENIPAGWSGLWLTDKVNLPKGKLTIHEGDWVNTPPGEYTFLRCITDSTMQYNPPGDVVMEDTPHELVTHLGFVMRACGKVLITGLGLGCVIRGLLNNPNVDHVTCIENSKDVLKLVAPYMPADRLTIIEADALEWTAKNKDLFDCAWHDLWTNEDKGEPHLDIWHAQLFLQCRKFVKQQGAWAFKKDAKALLIRGGFPWIG